MTKRICHNYKKWEDYKNGIYKNKTDDRTIKDSINLLSSPQEFDCVLNKMISNWKYSAEHNLTDPSINKRAWLGRAACCFEYGACIEETRIAWHSLSIEQQTSANNVAENIIKKWQAPKKQCQKLIWE